MVDFSQDAVFTELSKIFRGRVDPSRDGGLISPIDTHAQLMEIAHLVFLLNPGAIYYLAKLVRNSLYLVLRQEVDLAEDMLIAIDDLTFASRNDGQLVGNVGPSNLSNAETALLDLENAGSVSGRPELDRFARIINEFTGVLKQNVVSSNGQFMLPRGEARDILRLDLAQLKSAHSSLLLLANSLKDILTSYAAVNIPAKVSQTALINIRKQLAELKSLIQNSTAEQNIAGSRLYLLRALTAKVVTDLLSQFVVTDPTQPILTSFTLGSTALSTGTGPYLARAVGDGVPAFVLTSPGPWLLDELSTTTFAFSVDGGPDISIDLSEVQGPGMHGRNAVPFTSAQLVPTWPGPGAHDAPPPPPKKDYTPKNNLHLIVDPDQYEFTSQEWFPGIANLSFLTVPDLLNPSGPDILVGAAEWDIWNRVRMQPPVKLGFKHLGTPVLFELGFPESSTSPDFQKGSGFAGWAVDGDTTIEDAGEWEEIDDRRWPYLMRPRIITDLSLLKTVTLSHISGNRYSAPAGTFEDHYVGFYVRKMVGTADYSATVSVPVPAYERWEITQVVSSSEVVIDTRDDIEGAAAGSDIGIYGEPGDYTEISFSPDLLAHTDAVAHIDGGRGPANIKDTVGIKILPAIKTCRVPAGSGNNINSVLSSLKNTAFGFHTDQPYAHASYHVVFKEQSGHNGKITVQGRSRWKPDKLSVSALFMNARKLPQTIVPGEDGQRKYPGPHFMTVYQEGGHEVFGFDIGQRVDPLLDIYLDPKELLTLISAQLNDEAEAVIIEEDVFGGVINTVGATNRVEDPDANFATLDIGFGYWIELQSGDNKSQYIIIDRFDSTTLELQLAGAGVFAGSETAIPYRIYTKRIQISSANAGRGSSIQVKQAPTQFGLPTEIQYGVTPDIEAVNENEEAMDLSALSSGDSSEAGTVTAVSEDGTRATIAGGVSSGTVDLLFSFSSKLGTDLKTMLDELDLIVESANVLGQRHFNENLDAIDVALTPLLTPGLGLQSNQNQAKTIIAQLISLLTSSPRRTDLYTTQIPVSEKNIEDTIKEYDAPRVKALDSLLDSLNEFKFDRALQLLVTGQLEEFFSTTSETASFSGNLLAKSRAVVNDLPRRSRMPAKVEREFQLGQFRETVDPEKDFSDAQDPVDPS
jgi:hypothetical protein